jgi:hypothetical protein
MGSPHRSVPVCSARVLSMRLDCFRAALATMAVVLAGPCLVSAADVSVHFDSGRVSIDARDVPVSDILAEWSRVGQTAIVGREKIAGPPVTIQIVDVPESAALDIILRHCAGYAASGWPEVLAGASIFQRILIVTASNAPAIPDRTVRASSSPLAVAPPGARRTALPSIDVTPPALPGPAFESDTTSSDDSPFSFAAPWFPTGGLSRVPGAIAPPPQTPTAERPSNPPRIR